MVLIRLIPMVDNTIFCRYYISVNKYERQFKNYICAVTRQTDGQTVIQE